MEQDEETFSTYFTTEKGGEWNESLLDLSNDTLDDYIPYSSRPETYIVPILFAIIFIIGILGNGTLIVIFIKRRSMRNVPNMYICSLAFGDLTVIIFCVPFTSTLYTVDSWPYGEFVCKFSEFIKDVSIGVSVFTLTALSADRYFAIADPMRKLQGRRATRVTCITIAGIWLISIGFAMPSALFSYVKPFDQDPSRVFYVCYPFPEEFGDRYPQVMVMFHFLAYYFIPLLLISTFYIGMARHLVLSTKTLPGGESQGQAKQMQGRRKVAKMILSFVVIFAICFFPSNLFFLWFHFHPTSENDFNDFWHACRITGFCLSFINSCINPVTLYCVSSTFRLQYNEHLFCCCCSSRNAERQGRTRNGRQVFVPQGRLACACSLTGIQVHVQANNGAAAAAGDIPLPLRNGHGHGHSPSHHHHQNFRETANKDLNVPIISENIVAASNSSPEGVTVSPWFGRKSSLTIPNEGLVIPLNHKYSSQHRNKFADDHSC